MPSEFFDCAIIALERRKQVAEEGLAAGDDGPFSSVAPSPPFAVGPFLLEPAALLTEADNLAALKGEKELSVCGGNAVPYGLALKLVLGDSAAVFCGKADDAGATQQNIQNPSCLKKS